MEIATLFFSDNHPKSKDVRSQLIKNITKTSEYEMERPEMNYLKITFFSDENIDLINKQLILSVWKKTKGEYRIGFQDSNKLIIVMQYVFLEYAKHLPFDIKSQIRELNCVVIGEILPNVITNLEQKIGYLQEIEKRKTLLDLPISTSNNKTLPSIKY